MLPRQQKASLLFVLLCESVSENAKNEYSQISERTFPLGKFLNKPLGIVKVGNERDLVVRVVLCTGCFVRKAGQSVWLFLLFYFQGISLSDVNDGSSTMFNPDLFFEFMYMFQW